MARNGRFNIPAVSAAALLSAAMLGQPAYATRADRAALAAKLKMDLAGVTDPAVQQQIIAADVAASGATPQEKQLALGAVASPTNIVAIATVSAVLAKDPVNPAPPALNTQNLAASNTTAGQVFNNAGVTEGAYTAAVSVRRGNGGTTTNDTVVVGSSSGGSKFPGPTPGQTPLPTPLPTAKPE